MSLKLKSSTLSFFFTLYFLIFFVSCTNGDVSRIYVLPRDFGGEQKTENGDSQSTTNKNGQKGNGSDQGNGGKVDAGTGGGTGGGGSGGSGDSSHPLFQTRIVCESHPPDVSDSFTILSNKNTERFMPLEYYFQNLKIVRFPHIVKSDEKSLDLIFLESIANGKQWCLRKAHIDYTTRYSIPSEELSYFPNFLPQLEIMAPLHRSTSPYAFFRDKIFYPHSQGDQYIFYDPLQKKVLELIPISPRIWFHPQFSPDGQWISFLRRNGKLAQSQGIIPLQQGFYSVQQRKMIIIDEENNSFSTKFISSKFAIWLTTRGEKIFFKMVSLSDLFSDPNNKISSIETKDLLNKNKDLFIENRDLSLIHKDPSIIVGELSPSSNFDFTLFENISKDQKENQVSIYVTENIFSNNSDDYLLLTGGLREYLLKINLEGKKYLQSFKSGSFFSYPDELKGRRPIDATSYLLELTASPLNGLLIAAAGGPSSGVVSFDIQRQQWRYHTILDVFSYCRNITINPESNYEKK